MNMDRDGDLVLVALGVGALFIVLWLLNGCGGSSTRLPFDVELDAGVEARASIRVDYRVDVGGDEDDGGIVDDDAGVDASADVDAGAPCAGVDPNACGGCGGIAGLAAGDAIGDECGGAGACVGAWECVGPNLADCGGCE